MNSQLQVLRQFNRDMQPISQRYNDMLKSSHVHELLSNTQRTINSIRPIFEALENSQLQKTLKDIFDISKTIQPHSTALLDIARSVQPIQEGLQSVIDSIGTSEMRHLEAITSLPRTIEFYGHSVSLNGNFGRSNAVTSSEEFEEILEEISTAEVTKDEGGYIVDGEFVETSSIEYSLQQIVERLDAQDRTLESLVGQIISSKLKKSLKAILLYLLLPVALMIMFAEFYPKNGLRERFHLKEIRNEVEQIDMAGIPDSRKKQLRYVYVKTYLHVRSEGYIHSQIIDELRSGTVIVLIQKNKRWSLIEYVDPDTNEEYSGWVFSRYLKKFRP